MGQTSWQERREFEERLYAGQQITAHETQRLIDDADAAGRAEAALQALETTLQRKLGIAVLDSTTDDDDGNVRIELIKEDPIHQRLDALAQTGLTISLCFGECGDLGRLWSVDVLTPKHQSFPKRFAAETLELAVAIAETEGPKLLEAE